jgi:glyoxylase-like metal-dependent hydrolase (beta-lactamase superfamily II)
VRIDPHLVLYDTIGSGSICFHLRSRNEDGSVDTSPGLLFTGDTLFIGGSGRVDLPESDPKQMANSLARLSRLPDDVVVCTGHNYSAKPDSTIGKEKVHNMSMLQAVAEEEAAQQGKSGLTASRVNAMLPLPDYVEAMRRAIERVETGDLGHEHNEVGCGCLVAHTKPGYSARM